MDQLKTKLVSIILTIEEGRGMDFIKNPIILSANFNGRPLESDPVVPKDSLVFNTNLIWEIEKKTLRKIRSSNQPLRIDCLTIIDEDNRREKIGYLLLDLRSAYIGDTEVPFKWHKLVGMRIKKKNYRPELYLALSITDTLNQTPSNETCLIDKVSSESFGNTALKYLEDYIKIGDEVEGNTFFTLNILIKFASNLDILLPEMLVFHENKNKYCMSFKIFEIPIKTKQFYKDLHDKVVFEEKIVVKILSTIETIENFFKNQEIEVSFFSGDDKLGITTVELNTLMLGCGHFMDYYFKFPSPNGIVPMSIDGRKPFVQLEISLNRIETNKEAIIEDDKPELLLENEEIGEIKDEELKPTRIKHELPKKIISYRLVIKLRDLLMENKGLKYKFSHPKTNNSCLEIVDDKFNFQINLIYITTNEENLNNLLEFWPVKLIVINENDNLISKEHLIKSTINDSVYSVDLLSEDYQMLITKLQISTKLEKNNFAINDKNTLLPIILDDNLTVLELKELQEWKEMEKIEFENNLKELKKSMEIEWEEKKRQLDNDFEENMLKCQQLQDELQEKINLQLTNNERLIELEEENKKLKKEIEELKHEIEFDKQTALTKEQTSILFQELKALEEKFEMAQKCKNYFKEQCKQACDEVNQLKSGDYQQLPNQTEQDYQELDLNFNINNNQVGDNNWQQFFVN